MPKAIKAPPSSDFTLTLEPQDNERLANLCGPFDEHLREVALHFAYFGVLTVLWHYHRTNPLGQWVEMRRKQSFIRHAHPVQH